MDYSKTLNLPKTDFPMKANLPQREPDIQKLWDELQVYKMSLDRDGDTKWILHDGPPYSNGDVHVGNAMQNKLPKDFATRFRSMCGYNVPFIPGWDNHGMPIENNVAAEFRKKHLQPDRLAIRKRCREYAADYVSRQKKQYVRLGIRGDWDRPYLTMDPHVEADIVRVFGELVEKGYIYRGLRPIHWCPTCETALADAEIEYADHTSPSIFVFFPLRSDPSGVFDKAAGDAGVLIWTTTPWTLPANLAVAVHPDYEYVVAQMEGRQVLLARELLEATEKRTGNKVTPSKSIKGSDLDGLVFEHPLFDRPSRVVFASYVTLEEGTGVVHTAPGHGREDFETGRKYELDVLCPVDGRGVFTSEAGQFAGIDVWTGNKAVTEALTQTGALVAEEQIAHSYPHCWRCHNPVIYRATVQWFMNLDHNGHREKALAEIDGVRWLPDESINRIRAMVSGSPDWCVSRQRAWGVGIPVFFCEGCRSEIVDKELIDRVADIVEQHNADIWFSSEAADLLPSGYRCPSCGGDKFGQERDILDVWFDSGSTCRSVLQGRSWPELSYPADVYLEGNDQHRGWFNKSLMIGVATTGAAPFRMVVTNGWMVDAEGHAMHKSRGNVVDTMAVVTKFGADIIRLAAASYNVTADARLGDEVLQRTSDAYRRIRNTFRFLIANLYDYEPASGRGASLEELDLWMLHRLQELISACTEAYEEFQFHRVTHEIHNFCAVDLSALYLDITKDRLYADGAGWGTRRAAQHTLFQILRVLVRLAAPILAHTAEEVWQAAGLASESPSVHLARFPAADESMLDPALDERFRKLLEVREQVYRVIEQARQDGIIAKPMEAEIAISGGPYYQLLADDHHLLASLFIVSKVTLAPGTDEMQISVKAAPGVKCDRCWLIREDVADEGEGAGLCQRCATALSEISLPEGD